MPLLWRLPPVCRSASLESAAAEPGRVPGHGASGRPSLPKSGVSITPGLTALTRMFRPISSAASVRAKLRSAAFDADTADVPATPTSSKPGGREDDRPAIAQKRQCLLHGEVGAAEVGIENVIEDFLGRLRDGAQLGNAGIRAEDVNPSILLAYLLEQAV